MVIGRAVGGCMLGAPRSRSVHARHGTDGVRRLHSPPPPALELFDEDQSPSRRT